MKILKNTFLFILMFMMLMATSIVRSNVKGDIHKSFKVEKGGLLTIEADIGSINIETAENNEVDVKISFERRRGSRGRFEEIMKKMKVDFQHSKDDVTVYLEYNKRFSNFWNSAGRYLRVKFTVTVPAEYNVSLKTAGGSITVNDIKGRVKSKTSGGSLDFGDIYGSVYGRTSGGSITLNSCRDEVDLKTSGGSISIGKITGNIYAHTSGGSINIREALGTVDAHTSGGSITAYISEQPKNDCILKTSGGTVTVVLAEDIKMFVNASTSGGRVHTEFPVMVSGELSKRSLRAKINGGGPELYLRTSGGSIYLKK